MSSTTILLLALAIAAAVIIFWLRARGTSSQNPGIRGNIIIKNDCDGLLASIPDNVDVNAKLHDDQGNFVGTNARIGPLGPDPRGNPIKRGTYNLAVNIPVSWGTSKKWEISITKTDGSDICRPISCPITTLCEDSIGKPHTWNYTGWAMTKDINVNCVCR